MSTNKITKHQKFEAIVIHRSQIKNASYNPRKISDENFKRLKKNLKRVGLLSTIVYNEQTGNIISGHQRIKVLDILEKSEDYELTVAKVSLDEKEEKEQNIFFNNASAQGEWDRDLMLEVIGDVDLTNTGFDEVDLSMIGIEFDIEKHQNESVEDTIKEFERIKSENKQKNEESTDPDKKNWKDIKKEINKGHKNQDKEDFVVLSFDNYENKAAFMQRFGFPADDRYIKGEVFSEMSERI